MAAGNEMTGDAAVKLAAGDVNPSSPTTQGGKDGMSAVGLQSEAAGVAITGETAVETAAGDVNPSSPTPQSGKDGADVVRYNSAAAGVAITGEVTVETAAGDVDSSSPTTQSGQDCVNVVSVTAGAEESEAKSESEVEEITDWLSKLNPLAKEFVPSANATDQNQDQSAVRRNGGRRQRRRNQGRRRMTARAVRAQREDCIRRTVYVSDIDHLVSEELLAGVFSCCGLVSDCRICGDPNSPLRFAFVEFKEEYAARAALNLTGALLGVFPIKVLPSKTAILPVNPRYLPRSEDDIEKASRTVYCTNIDKKVTTEDVKTFFESRCGQVSRLRLLGDQVQSTRIAFVEFVAAESAILSLTCCGQLLGSHPVRVSPSKTPVRVRNSCNGN